MYNGNPPGRGPHAVNWNRDLIWKMRTDLKYQWKLFEEEIPTIFEKLMQRLKNNLDKLELHLGGLDPKSVEGTRVHTQDFEHMYSRIQREFENGVRSIHGRASESDSQSYVVQEMIPTYDAASEISGPEKATQQRTIIQGKIKDGTLFDGILRHLISDMEEQFETFHKVKDFLYETVDSVRENFDMIMSDAEEKQKAEERLKKQLADEVQQLLGKYQEIRFSMLKF
ncbi:hypothetical protein TSTA_063350 [Talaromyces stipitatus ATCC 10500]|uniref:DUF7605 domain-containing protein n=1 Tax=Talaromyces stipitatus (strain ATCC 10500 / CBS 375.48 / QM 6759 / NRRL 1006) TaxID=441959 RepID=B8LYC5_TALSN|nr:uncharacterized protein TSTA_063350 [Talaromyces stipitatus ATCC 10500]EED22854.1 hypothetical protein TSTA_063350 [Talaromyces stipitatus ATCC 10500]